MTNKKLHIMMETVFMAVLAFILSFIPIKTTNFDIAIGLIPIILLGLRRGVLPASTAGLIWGLLDLISGKASILNPWQGFIEYIIAFAFAGACGIFAKKMAHTSHPNFIIISATTTGVVARYIWHFIAGGIFWGSFAPKTINPWIFSFISNGLSALATIVVVSLVLILMHRYATKLFQIA